MNDGRDHDDRHRRPGPDGPHDREHRGPIGTEFLDLEISKVAYAEASSLTREAIRVIIKEAIEARLRERLGPRLEALGRIAADELADDLDANLDIEARIAARRDKHQSTENRVREAMRGVAAKAARSAPKRKERKA